MSSIFDSTERTFMWKKVNTVCFWLLRTLINSSGWTHRLDNCELSIKKKLSVKLHVPFHFLSNQFKVVFAYDSNCTIARSFSHEHFALLVPLKPVSLFSCFSFYLPEQSLVLRCHVLVDTYSQVSFFQSGVFLQPHVPCYTWRKPDQNNWHFFRFGWQSVHRFDVLFGQLG